MSKCSTFKTDRNSNTEIRIRFLLPGFDAKILSDSELFDLGTDTYSAITRSYSPNSPDQVLTVSAEYSTDITEVYQKLHDNLVQMSPEYKLNNCNRIKILVHEFHADKITGKLDDFPAKYNVMATISTKCMFRSVEVVVDLHGLMTNCVIALRKIIKMLAIHDIPKGLKQQPYNIAQYNESRAEEQFSYRFDDVLGPAGSQTPVIQPPPTRFQRNNNHNNSSFSLHNRNSQNSNHQQQTSHAVSSSFNISAVSSNNDWMLLPMRRQETDDMSISSTVIGSVKNQTPAVRNAMSTMISTPNMHSSSISQNHQVNQLQTENHQLRQHIQKLTMEMQQKVTENYCLQQKIETHAHENLQLKSQLQNQGTFFENEILRLKSEYESSKKLSSNGPLTQNNVLNSTVTANPGAFSNIPNQPLTGFVASNKNLEPNRQTLETLTQSITPVKPNDSILVEDLMPTDSMDMNNNLITSNSVPKSNTVPDSNANVVPKLMMSDLKQKMKAVEINCMKKSDSAQNYLGSEETNKLKAYSYFQDDESSSGSETETETDTDDTEIYGSQSVF